MTTISQLKTEMAAGAVTTRLRKLIEGVVFDQRLSETGRRYLWARVEGGPSRHVQGRLGNRVYDFHSRKMGMRHKLESHRGEYVQAMCLEHDPEVLAYFPQPPQVSLEIRDPDGTLATTTPYTPDFLVVRSKEIYVQETRHGTALTSSALKNGHQFYVDERGQWRYRAAEEYFGQLGLGYHLIANHAQNAQLVANLNFLRDYLDERAAPVSEAVVGALRQTIDQHRMVPFPALLADGFTADQILKAIADGGIYVDLERDRLGSTQDFVLYSDAPTRRFAEVLDASRRTVALPTPGTYMLKPLSKVTEGNKLYTVVLASEREVVLEDETGTKVHRPLAELLEARALGHIHIEELRPEGAPISIADVSTEELHRAEQKFDAARTGDTTQFSQRSLARFRQLIQDAKNDMEAILMLVDRRSERGNRKARLSARHLGLVDQAFREHHNDERNTRKKGSWEHYLGLCRDAVEDIGVPVKPISYATFCRYAQSRASVLARKGKRAAYQCSPILPSLDDTLPIHGTRPHEICYIDHTVANISLMSPHGKELGKPTQTVAIDGTTCQVRATYLGFDPPSAGVVLLVLRDYVRRHGRLPDCISVDNGKEFRSRELRTFCKRYAIDLRFRAPGQPRGGAMIERLLGATEDEMLSEMKGNTRLLKKDTRQVTKTVNPFNHTVWTLTALYYALEDYYFQDRATRIHPTLGETPNDYERRRVAETGFRPMKGVVFDANLLLHTSPHTKRSHRIVDERRGVQSEGIWYQHPAIRALKPGTKVEVRIEPWNASVLYVNIGKQWVTAVGNCSRWVARRTSREVEIALRRERKQDLARAQRQSVDPAHRTERWKQLRPEDFDPRLATQQDEMLYLYDRLGMAFATPEARRQLAEPIDVEPIASLPMALPPPSNLTASSLPQPVPAAVATKAARPGRSPPSSPLVPLAEEPELADEVVEIMEDGSQAVLVPASQAPRTSALRRTGRFL